MSQAERIAILKLNRSVLQILAKTAFYPYYTYEIEELTAKIKLIEGEAE